jgi:hypothetical protein
MRPSLRSYAVSIDERLFLDNLDVAVLRLAHA